MIKLKVIWLLTSLLGLVGLINCGCSSKEKEQPPPTVVIKTIADLGPPPSLSKREPRYGYTDDADELDLTSNVFLNINISGDGSIFWSTANTAPQVLPRAADIDSLVGLIIAQNSIDTSLVTLIMISPDARYQRFVDVLDAIPRVEQYFDQFTASGLGANLEEVSDPRHPKYSEFNRKRYQYRYAFVSWTPECEALISGTEMREADLSHDASISEGLAISQSAFTWDNVMDMVFIEVRISASDSIDVVFPVHIGPDAELARSVKNSMTGKQVDLSSFATEVTGAINHFPSLMGHLVVAADALSRYETFQKIIRKLKENHFGRICLVADRAPRGGTDAARPDLLEIDLMSFRTKN